MTSEVISIRDLLGERSLEDQVKDICNFYNAMTGIWTSWELNDGKTLQLTGNRLTTPHSNHDTSRRSSYGSDECPTIIKQEDPGSSRMEPIPQVPPAAAMSSKRKFDANSDAMSTLGALTFEMKKAHNLKRRKLDMVNQRLALDAKNFCEATVHVLDVKLELMDAKDHCQDELREALLETQIGKLNAKIEIMQAETNAAIAMKRTMLEIELIKAYSMRQ
ncbi:hypothetical protein BGZ80_001913 [Entomortierella chlamydospora]|uniref:Uncharacterized protein n=1 Tax=Entomortierella chlamydospora TaxID=101097 RepID=A0A9P6SY07_9FUNG|nr:hypothetical protein BGZ80_001913 [Entomortierella chlamydospora]